MGSQTVFGTVKICYKLRAFGVVTTFLIVLWTLNPLGGQASIRALTLQRETLSNTVQVQYLNSDPRSTLYYSGFVGASSFASYSPMIRTLYGSALFAPDAGTQYANGSSASFSDLINRLGGLAPAIKTSTMDMWGNVRIPVIHLLPNFDPSQPQEWTDVPSDEVAPYSSIIGVPSRGLPASGIGNATFDVTANYDVFMVRSPVPQKLHLLIVFKCSQWINFTESAWNTWWANNNGKFILYNMTVSQENKTVLPFSNGVGGFFVDTQEPFTSYRRNIWPNDTSAQLPARDLTFGSNGASGNVYFTTCQISMEYVDARISCSRSTVVGQLNCAATAVRLSSSTHLPNNWTEIESEGVDGMLTTWSTIMGTQHVQTSTPTEVYIYDPPAAFTGDTLTIHPVELGDVPIEVFEQRFMLLYNTYWRSALIPWAVLGGVFNASQSEFEETGSIPFINTSTQWNFPSDPVYVPNKPWIVLYLIATSTLCLCAILTIIIQCRVQTPDILGYVSSLSRDSPYTAMPGCSSTLNGSERARLLKNHWTRIEDVQPNCNVGKIAFSMSSEKGVGLRADRLYE